MKAPGRIVPLQSRQIAGDRPGVRSSQDAVVICMVDMLRDQQSWSGQTHLQKAIFFAQAMLRLPLGFDYVLYKYGPFSRALESSIHRLERDTALTFLPQEPPFGPRLVTSEGAELIRENEPGVIAAYDEHLGFVAAAIGRKSIKELERLASALWFMVDQPRASPADVSALVHARKPHVSVAEALNAFQEVQRLGRTARRRGLIEADDVADRRRLPDTTASSGSERLRSQGSAPMVVDVASAGRRLSSDEFARWAQSKTVFVSSEMADLAGARAAVAESLRQAGFSVILFEGLGGRDEGAERAYLSGVARSDIYVGIVAGRYGRMLASGRSPTHEEYLEARRLGKRISFWVADNPNERQGNASDFVQEVQAFHTTGRFADTGELCQRLLERLAEVAGDDEVPWIKIGQTCLRASRIRDEGEAIIVTAEVRDPTVARALEGLRSDLGGAAADISIATSERAGDARITRVVSERHSASLREIEIRADVRWKTSGGATGHTPAAGSAGDLVEHELRLGLLGESVMSGLSIVRADRSDVCDPLADLAGLSLSQPTEESVATLLLCEALVATGKASRIERFALGPVHGGKRRVELVYAEPLGPHEVEAALRVIEGLRREHRQA
jgi:hypothetical protein